MSSSCLVMSNSLWPHGLPWNFPGKNTGLDCQFLVQGIFLTQESNLGLPHCLQILFHLSHQGRPYIILLLHNYMNVNFLYILLYFPSLTRNQHANVRGIFLSRLYLKGKGSNRPFYGILLFHVAPLVSCLSVLKYNHIGVYLQSRLLGFSW